MHNECLGWDENSKVQCDLGLIQQKGTACLAKGRVEVSIPPKSLDTLLCTLDRFKPEDTA
jgi:hypothetical protein